MRFTMVRPSRRRAKDDKHAIVVESSSMKPVNNSEKSIKRYFKTVETTTTTTTTTNGDHNGVQELTTTNGEATNGTGHDESNGCKFDVDEITCKSTAAAACSLDGSIVHNTSMNGKKPTTPHRILCPPSSPDRQNVAVVVPNGGLNPETQRSRKRIDQPKFGINHQNTKELSGDTHKTATSATAAAQQQHKVTDFFPIRRSARKTKQEVQNEILKSYEKAVLSQIEDGLEVRIFECKGRGIVAARSFTKGEFVVEYAGDLICMSEANKREVQYAEDDNTGCYMYYFKHNSQQYCIDATEETGRLGRLINHSKNGNLTTKIITIHGKPHLVLIAKHDIRTGEELMYDYGDRSKEALTHHPWLAF